jgi:hypothetical protein
MHILRLLMRVFILLVVMATASAQTPRPGANTPPPNAPAPADNTATATPAKDKPGDQRTVARSYLSQFTTSALAGGTVNDLIIPVTPTELWAIPTDATICWRPAGQENTNAHCDPAAVPCGDKIRPINVLSKKPVDGDAAKVRLSIDIPQAPCWWPISQYAKITIRGHVSESSAVETFFDETVPVTVYWFPLLMTLLAVALIYPGCAIASWYASHRRYRRSLLGLKRGEAPPTRPTGDFLIALDPVELTKNAYGRASVAKLQIFLFTMIVFALLLFFMLRFQVLASISSDVLLLLGISAFGAAGSKLVSNSRRRLSLENWAWLRRKGWLPPLSDVAPRAKWSELVLDADTKEFDAYSFQMIIFSIVVAVALISTSVTGLGTFQIPMQLLALLGISQVVFIGGQAIDKNGYSELGAKLDDVRKHEEAYQELITKTQPAAQPADATVKALTPADAEVERKAFKSSVAQAAEMFWAVYGDQIGPKPPELRKALDLEPELHQAAPAPA